MPSADTPALIVARFLNANRYDDTLAAFIAEAGLPEDAGAIGKDDLSLEKVLEEKKIFDLSLRVEKTGLQEENGGWRDGSPKFPTIVPLPASSNLLHVSIVRFGIREPRTPLLAATTADRCLHLLHPEAPDFPRFNTTSSLFTSKSPVLAISALPYPDLFATVSTSMSGTTVIYDQATGTVLSERQDHTKYVPSCAITTPDSPSVQIHLATAGWDGKIFIYRLVEPSTSQPPTLGDPIARIDLPTNPEAITFVQHPETYQWILLVTRRDSTSIYFYALPETLAEAPLEKRMTFLGSQNLAPHSTGWIAFSPSSIAVCPTDPTLVAIATNSVPHMRLMIVRLLFPPTPTTSSTASPALLEAVPAAPLTQASQARAELEKANKEEAAIRINVSTLAPQTPYSTPKVVWRPDGTGVWVNGDDGAIRGIEAKTGKIVTTLKGGHEAGSKIRALGAGWLGVGAEGKGEGEGEEERGEECLVSGGFDQRLIVWKGER